MWEAWYAHRFGFLANKVMILLSTGLII
jgi:hypothetical protein